MLRSNLTIPVEPPQIDLYIPQSDGSVELEPVPVDHIELVSRDANGDWKVRHISPWGDNWRTLTLTEDDILNADWLADEPQAS